MMKFARQFALMLLGALASCVESTPGPDLHLKPVPYSAISGWSADASAGLLPILRATCHKIEHLPPETVLGGTRETIPNGSLAGEWLGACRALASVPNTDQTARQYFEQWFAPYLVSDDGFYTGYYEPQISAAAHKGGVFQVPLYAQPADLVHTRDTVGDWVTGRWRGRDFIPYYTRTEIDQGALEGKGLEIAWLRSLEDLFFLQIQGSGRLVMTDGSIRRVGFSAKNGHPYVPIGRVLVRENALAPEDVSLSSLRNWLTVHPDRARSVMEQNPNYVFFRRVDTIPLDYGVPGAMGLSLVPGRSVAVDRAVLPLGVPVWVDTKIPLAGGGEGRWSHLTFAQDVGSDIKGPGRADLFTGWGEEAERLAGSLRSHGRMIVLLPHPPA